MNEQEIRALEVDPAHVSEAATAFVLLRNPETIVRHPSGLDVLVAPCSDAFQWNEVPVIADPANCEHGASICYSCAGTWGIDHYLKVYNDNNLSWQSWDLPIDIIDL